VNNEHANRFVIPTFVNGVECSALRDTGASCTLINSKTMCHCVKPIEGRCMVISGVTGQLTIPVAEVLLFSPHFKCSKEVSVTVGLVDNLAYDLLLGNDIFIHGCELVDVVKINPWLDGNSAAAVSSENIERGVKAVTTGRQASNADDVSHCSLSTDEQSVNASHTMQSCWSAWRRRSG
jgi:hypothetical protein